MRYSRAADGRTIERRQWQASSHYNYTWTSIMGVEDIMSEALQWPLV